MSRCGDIPIVFSQEKLGRSRSEGENDTDTYFEDIELLTLDVR